MVKKVEKKIASRKNVQVSNGQPVKMSKYEMANM